MAAAGQRPPHQRLPAERPRRRRGALPSRRSPDERFYGLGEKAGDLQRNGKRYEMRNLDAMGYNAASTDPLYKHIPFTITRRPTRRATACSTTT